VHFLGERTWNWLPWTQILPFELNRDRLAVQTKRHDFADAMNDADLQLVAKKFKTLTSTIADGALSFTLRKGVWCVGTPAPSAAPRPLPPRGFTHPTADTEPCTLLTNNRPPPAARRPPPAARRPPSQSTAPTRQASA
jgi:hypothetical protein